MIYLIQRLGNNSLHRYIQYLFYTSMSNSSPKKSLFELVKIKVERKFGRSQYGKSWTKDNEWYNTIHDSNPLLHQNFIAYLKEKTDVKTVLEIGCGTGIYPIQMK